MGLPAAASCRARVKRIKVYFGGELAADTTSWRPAIRPSYYIPGEDPREVSEACPLCPLLHKAGQHSEFPAIIPSSMVTTRRVSKN